MAHLPAVMNVVVYDSVYCPFFNLTGFRIPGMFEKESVSGLDKLSPAILHAQAGKSDPIVLASTYAAYVTLKSLRILPATGFIFFRADSRSVSSGIVIGIGENLFSNLHSSDVL